MAAPTGWIRYVMLLWAALQIALPPVLTLVDANSAAASAGQVIHVESASTPACHRAHGADCAFCQFLSNCLGTMDAAAPPRIAAIAHVRPAATQSSLDASAARSLPGSRAPPAV
ncbi:MAG: hypothetical protein JWM41_3383 [Gemmatimonadetes bacterium]|nr:hypothetical protein [Gemmatimonadota bacterium]